MKSNAPNLQHEALSVLEAAEAAGISKNSTYALIWRGELPARKLGRRTIVLRADLNSFLQKLPVYQPGAAQR